jgi:hypothetical protein
MTCILKTERRWTYVVEHYALFLKKSYVKPNLCANISVVVFSTTRVCSATVKHLAPPFMRYTVHEYHQIFPGEDG